MFKQSTLILFALITLLISCGQKSGNPPYAIKDFKKSLQPHLHRIVTAGIVMGGDSALEHMASDAELLKLTQSEHPILRAGALSELLRKKPPKLEDILLNHLDDTAYILMDAGEFGNWWRTVSDYMLNEEYLRAYGTHWKPKEADLKIIDRLLLKHNYLLTAYRVLIGVEPQEKYYGAIKDMAARTRKLSYDGYEIGFDDIEYALYGLARFKKKEDIHLIKEKMLKKYYEMSDVSFRLMKEFPDTAYADVLSTYHRRQFYKFNGNRRRGFTGYDVGNADPEDFIEALVAQKNYRSAGLLDTMLILLPQEIGLPDQKKIIRKVILDIWNYPCPAYTKLREKIKPKVDEYIKKGVYELTNKDGSILLE